MRNVMLLLDKKRKYKGSLPCSQCGTSLLHNCIKNAVRYVQGREDKPVKIWSADLYECPNCHNVVMTDFGWPSTWSKKNTPDLTAKVAELTRSGEVLIYSWQFNGRTIIPAQADIDPGRLLFLAVGEGRAAA